jgi:hypothetical protein
MAIKKTGGFKYSSDPDAIADALADLGGGNFFKPIEGQKNVVRILPPYNDSGKYFFEAKLHYGFKQGGKTISIPHVPGGYIEKKLNALASEGEEGSKLAKRYGVRTKFYVNVIDRATGQVKIWGFSKKIMQALNSFYKDDEDGGMFDDPESGYDVIIERTGKGLDTKYEIRFKVKPTPAIPAGEEAPELFDLEAETSKEFTAGELKEIWAETFAGAGNEKVQAEDDDVEDEEPVAAKKKKVVDEDDDDEEEEAPVAKKKKVVEEDDDDDAEEEPVVKKRRPVSEDDDEEEPVVRKKRAVAEEEEEAPVRKRTRR